MDSKFDRDIIIKLLSSESFEELMEYTNIVDILHNHPSEFDELIKYMNTFHLDLTDWFIGFLLYRFIIDNDSISITHIRNSAYFNVHSLARLINLIYKVNNLDLMLSHTWIIN